MLWIMIKDKEDIELRLGKNDFKKHEETIKWLLKLAYDNSNS